MSKEKRHYSNEQKVRMILEGLSYPDGIAAYCRSKGIKDTLFYKWKNQLLSNANAVFSPGKKETSKELRMKEELIKKDSIISELVEENIELKKKYGF